MYLGPLHWARADLETTEKVLESQKGVCRMAVMIKIQADGKQRALKWIVW